MPGDVGSKWELLLAFENALTENYAQFRTAENTHLASVFGAVSDGGGVDLFIPDGAVFSIKQDPTKLVDPADCPVGYLALQTNDQGAMGPVSAAGEATVSLSLYLYVTDRIFDSEGTYRLTERELVIMSQAFEQAVISAVRFLGPNSVWTAGAGIKSPNVTNSLSRSYSVAGDGDSVTAIQIQQTWTMVQTVRY